ncbi:MAG: efflux transporter outer membrane subunit [Pseudoflavonifractor sp.]|nr:efflux transporter outer membrane subunit [Alloprevotella sp.]MCM1117232.1 efflux transporter outer membrane subunit [Pseudoflavonifractor sp.]
MSISSIHAPRVLSFITLACIAACAAAQEPLRGNDIPERWIYTPEYSQTIPPDDNWWRGFSDPLLDSLITEAVTNNYNVAIAAHRIAAAEAAVASARAAYFPSIGISAGYNLGQQSGNMSKVSTSAMKSRYMSLGLSAQWEIDLFGRITSQVKQEKALLEVSKADYDGAMVSLCASLASAYVSLRQDQQREAVLMTHLETEEKVVNIVKSRYEASLVSDLDMAQSETVYGAAKASLPSIRNSIASEINAIALLLGCYPAEVEARLSRPAYVPAYAGIVATSVPAELLRRRPDIVAAERTVAAQAAALGVARKEFLPMLEIRGAFGFDAREPSKLFKKQSITYSVEPTLSWTIFEGFGRKAAVAEANASMEVAIDQYRQTILSATSEVENALSTYINAKAYVAELEKVVASAQREVDLSLVQYRTGLTLFTPVAQALTSYLQYDDELVSARASESQAIITLYRALGGGFRDYPKH